MKIVPKIFHSFFRHNCPHLAAQISFYSLLTVLPLIFIVVIAAGYFLKGMDVNVVSQMIGELLRGIPSSDVILGEVQKAIQRGGSLRWVSAIMLIFVSSGLFSSIDKALHVIFENCRGRNFFHSKLISFGLVLGVPALLLFPVIIKVAEPVLRHIGVFLPLSTWITMRTAVYVIAFLSFTVVVKVLPSCKVPLRATLVGAMVFIALLWCAKQLFAVWVLYVYQNYTMIYGSLASIIMSVVWIYYLNLAFLFSAEVSAAVEEWMRVRRERSCESGSI